ncbi:MAG: M23 family metallopeptidase [Anaerolineaceae bacterium]|nr:MAG: M23 family metallopeptidase [Anaerolineaceae bacterium]
MNPEFREESPRDPKGDAKTAEKKPVPKKVRRNLLTEWVTALLSLGLGESMLRVGTTLLSLILIVAAIWLLSVFNDRMPQSLRLSPAFAAGPTPTPLVDPSLIPPPISSAVPGVSRLADPHTNVPSRPRQEIIKYTVQSGDSVFGIAEKFGLQPQTILWANYNTLVDDPHSLRPGQELNILPVNGVYYEWLGDISFESWAEFFGVTAQDIIDYPGNNLSPETVGDYANPNIPKGTWLIIPGGKREFTTWYAPIGVTREDPATARAWGPGACGPVAGGNIGYGSYIWPAAHHFLSGYDYSPESNHWGIDIDGETGDPVYATDAGVIVYSGWNDYGYGNMIMIDHGDNWQSLYAHLESIWVGCGESVGQGQTIGAVGSTGKSSGSHLHFEIMHGTYKVNPWDYLPPP